MALTGNLDLKQMLDTEEQNRFGLEKGSQLFERYQILRQISGSRVYLCADQHNSSRLLALKIGPRADIFSEEFNLRREFINHSLFDSNHIVKLDEAVETDSHFGFLMEYIGGGDLGDLINSSGKVTVETAVKIFKNIASALAHVHEKGFMHADIKPENILVTSSGDVKLTDFGLCRDLRSACANDEETKGTLRYLCPIYLTTGALHQSSDIYSLGLVIYELLTGKIPFEDSDIMKTLKNRVYEEVPSVKGLVPNISEKLSVIIGKCLSIDLSKRYQTSIELSEDLNKLLKVSRQERRSSSKIRLFKEMPIRQKQATIIDDGSLFRKFA